MENKFLKYIQNKDDNLLSDLSLPEKNQAETLLRLMKNSIPDIEVHNCNHDIEDICVFVEKEILSNQTENSDADDFMELIRERIFECDSCFDTYSFLKKAVPEINNLTPQYIKEKVYQKNNDSDLKKKSIWYIIRHNKMLKYSSGAVAAMFLLFFSISPLNTDMSDFHQAKESNQISEVPEKPTSQNEQVKKDEKLNDFSSSEEKPMPNSPPKIEEKDYLKLPAPSKKSKPVLSDDANVRLPERKINLEKPALRQRSEISLKNPPSILDNKNVNSPVSKPVGRIVINNKVFKKEAVNKNNSGLEESVPPNPVLAEPEKEKALSDENTDQQLSNQSTQAEKSMPDITKTAPEISIKDKFNDRDKEDDKDFGFAAPKSEANNNPGSITEKPKAPAPNKVIESDNRIQQSPLETSSGARSNNIVKSKDNGSIKNKVEEIILNFRIIKKGFIVAKDLDNKIIGQSNLLNPNDYKNFNLRIENSSKKFFLYIYSDLNNNGILDKGDLLEKSL